MRSILVIFVAFIVSAFGKEGEYVPENFPEERYQHIWIRKPFSPPTPQAPTVQAEGIEQLYVLSGLLKIGEEWTAFVQDRKSLKRHSVSGIANEIGLQLVSVKEGAEAPIVTLKSGQQIGVIRFDPSITHRANHSLKPVEESSHMKPPPNLPNSSPADGIRSGSPIQTLQPNLLNSPR
ncbi:MAG: hypothetical protein C5B47_05850 [Verrucomicrobia bacterium]|nr:MAG: hypothetical protein C5B47_05850 [Verrucomicrobiota bacterium]